MRSDFKPLKVFFQLSRDAMQVSEMRNLFQNYILDNFALITLGKVFTLTKDNKKMIFLE